MRHQIALAVIFARMLASGSAFAFDVDVTNGVLHPKKPWTPIEDRCVIAATHEGWHAITLADGST
jgi:hypothetical protein